MSRIYTYQDLQTRSLTELHALRGELQRALSLAAPYSMQAREAFASIVIVDRLIRLRSPRLQR